MQKIILGIILIMMSFVTICHCDTKLWIHDSDISNPKHWVNGTTQNICDGLVFAKSTNARVLINHLKVKQIILPRSGTIKFSEQSLIEFDENSKEKLNCVALHNIDYEYWRDVTSWYNNDQPDNPAVPHAERIPCSYDDVVFPKGVNSSVILETTVRIKSMRFGDKDFTRDDLINFLKSEDGQDVFSGAALDTIRVNNLYSCDDPRGCLCGTSQIFSCVNLHHKKQFKCKQPVVPVGFCEKEPICGGSIFIKNLKRGFSIDKIKKKMKDYESSTYASRIYKYASGNGIQVIFAEKDFTGKSLEEIGDLYNWLLRDEGYQTNDIELLLSGLPTSDEGAQTRNAFTMIFGTLFGVVLMFVLMLLIFSPTIGSLNLRNRLLGARPISTYVSARYDNIEDRRCIFDGQSMADSVISLNRAFENPMYEATPSTRSTSNDTIAPKQEEEKTESFEDVGKEHKFIELETALEEIALERESKDVKEGILFKNL